MRNILLGIILSFAVQFGIGYALDINPYPPNFYDMNPQMQFQQLQEIQQQQFLNQLQQQQHQFLNPCR